MRRWKIKSPVAALLLCTFLGIGAVADAKPATDSKPATFTVIQSPNGYFANYALSGNGNVMAANFGGEIYRWTAQRGFVDIGAGSSNSASIGISADGNFIAATRLGQDGNTSPARWNRATGWLDLGHPKNGCPLSGDWGDAYGVSGNGSIVVGLAWNCAVRAEGFAWSQGRMVSLGTPHGASSRASAISADGSTIVGFFEDPKQGFRRAVRWRNGMKDLVAGNHNPGEATAVSSDGSQIVGQATIPPAYNGYALYYTDVLGAVSLGTISHSPYDSSLANGVSDNGVVVGWSGNQFSGGTQAFIWRAKSPKAGMLSLHDYLVSRGAVVPPSLFLTDALAISADGSTVVGEWQDANFHFGAFMAHLK
jgi:probable HAF family extracellular repeat protein